MAKEIITREDYAKMIEDVKVLDDFIVFTEAAFHGELPAIHESTRQRWRALESDPIKFKEFKEQEIDFALNRCKVDYVPVSEIERRVKSNKRYCKNFPDLSLITKQEVIKIQA